MIVRLVVLALVVSVSAVHAEPRAQVLSFDQRGLRVRVVDAPNVAPAAVKLRVDGGPPVAATTVTEFGAGDETVAIAFVLQGAEVWVGNDELEQDPAATYPGVLKALGPAFDGLVREFRAPAGSTGTVIAYNEGAKVVVPHQNLATFPAGALGKQVDYRGKIGSDLVQGVTLAVAELAKTTAPIKVMIILGDGTDTNFDTARAQLEQLGNEVRAREIRTSAISYKGPLSSEGNVLTKLSKDATVVSSVDAMVTALRAVLDRIASQRTITFPAKLPFDGREHAVTVEVGGVMLDPISINAGAAPTSASLLAKDRLPHALGGILGICVLALLVVWLASPSRRAA